MTRAIIASTIVSLFVAACAAEDSDALRGPRRGSGAPGADGEDPSGQEGSGQDPDGTSADPTQPGTCKVGAPHVGFASLDFVADRKAGAIGDNRRRVKPYSALRTEFQRVLGQAPAALAASESAFGQVPARWYIEPTAGAVSLYTTYSLAFTGCYDTMNDATFAAQPTQQTAEAECAKLQRKAWQRTATPAEIKACADFVMDLSTESVARRRWAHACASIMTSAGFTTY